MLLLTCKKMLLLTCTMSYSSVGKQRSSKIGAVRCSQLYWALHRFLPHLPETEKKVAIWTNPVCLFWGGRCKKFLLTVERNNKKNVNYFYFRPYAMYVMNLVRKRLIFPVFKFNLSF